MQDEVVFRSPSDLPLTMMQRHVVKPAEQDAVVGQKYQRLNPLVYLGLSLPRGACKCEASSVGYDSLQSPSRKMLIRRDGALRDTKPQMR